MLAPWKAHAEGRGWVTQPIIVVQGRTPFFADHPAAYVAELEKLHADKLVRRGKFHTLIGEFQDEMDRADWGSWDG